MRITIIKTNLSSKTECFKAKPLWWLTIQAHSVLYFVTLSGKKLEKINPIKMDDIYKDLCNQVYVIWLIVSSRYFIQQAKTIWETFQVKSDII